MRTLGTRSWNYNAEGVAHYGMIADLLQELIVPVIPRFPLGSHENFMPKKHDRVYTNEEAKTDPWEAVLTTA